MNKNNFTVNQLIDEYYVSYNNFNCIHNKMGDKYYEIKNMNYDKLYDNTKIYNNLTDNMDDGIYVWMILSCDEREDELYIVKCGNINEYGTKHSNIIYNLKTKHKFNRIVLHYAGELCKHNDDIKLNFASGSYMRYIFEKEEMNPTKNTITRNIYANEVLGYLKGRHPKLTCHFTETDLCTMITAETVPLQIEHLLLYKLCDCEICVFDSIEECRTYLKNKKEWNSYNHSKKLYDIHTRNGKRILMPREPEFRYECEIF